MSSSKSVILITGANTGLGLATARLLLLSSSSSGGQDKHIILCSRHLSSATTAISTLLPNPNDAAGATTTTTLSALELDVTDPQSVRAAVERVGSDHGYLSVLVNNAGISPKCGSLREDAAAAMGTNVVGAVGMTEACLGLLRKAPVSPRIVYLGSGLSSITLANDPSDAYHALDVTAYRASKAAINMVAVQQAKILGKEGIKVFVVDPGFRATGLSGNAAAAKARGAGDPEGGAQVVVDVVEGRRDGDVGKLVHEGGVHPW